MNTVLTTPQQRITSSFDPSLMGGTDPYGLGYPVSDYRVLNDREIAVYELGNGAQAFLSYNLQFGYAVVIQNCFGQELYAGRSASEQESRSVASRYIC